MKVFIITKRTLLYIAVGVAAVVAAIILLMSLGADSAPTMSMRYVEPYELSVMTGARKELPVYSVERSDKKIALTVDAAWEDDKTDFILEQLKKYNIKATFFLCGFWAEKYPDHVKAIIASGNEIGNHTATHPHMNKLSSAQMVEELISYDDLLYSIASTRSKLFRPPYGEYNDTVIKTARENGYEVIQWNIDTIDWKEERSAQTILDTVFKSLAPGSIILCHNNGFKIKEYLPALIEKAQADGYEFVTVSELLLSGETKIDVNGVQKPA